jgi:hypothetical protein
MKSPSQMKRIQIDITNACFNSCSNCTRFCGNHSKTFNMSWTQFRKACESLYDFPGMIGIIGGEPTLHPEFDRFINYYSQVFPKRTKAADDVNSPIGDIMAHRNTFWNNPDLCRRGLWTSFGPGYKKHYELIRDVFEYQCVNDHKNAGQHQANMISRKELGIPDDEFFKLRDACWLQNNWSATITPKGAFFCEVAGAMDMLLDGPGGWPVEYGWWRRPVEEFGNQLNWCELCGHCLAVPYNISNTNTDIVSPEWDKRLAELGSKKKRIVFDEINRKNPEPYLVERDNTQRLCEATTDALKLQSVVMVMVCSGYSKMLATTLPLNINQADHIIVVTEKEDEETIELCKQYDKVEVVISDKRNLNDGIFNKGAMINEGIELAKKYNKWVLLTDADIIFPKDFREKMVKDTFNPGTLYYAERVHIPANEIKKYVVDPVLLRRKNQLDGSTNKKPWGYFQLFNVDSSYLNGTLYSEDYLSAGYVDKDFRGKWPQNRRFCLPIRLIHIAHGERGVNWHGVK